MNDRFRGIPVIANGSTTGSNRSKTLVHLPTLAPVPAVVFSCLLKPLRVNSLIQSDLMVHVMQDGVGHFVPERVTVLDVTVIPR